MIPYNNEKGVKVARSLNLASLDVAQLSLDLAEIILDGFGLGLSLRCDPRSAVSHFAQTKNQ